MNLRKTYIICATQRSGSTLLCDLLSKTNLVGKPREYLLPQYEPKAELPPYHNYVHDLLVKYSAENGTTGVKLMENNFTELLQRLRISLNVVDKTDVDILASVFPKLSFIFITRQNKLRQAISLSRAEQSEVWEKHNEGVSTKSKKFDISPHYIRSAYNRIIERESFWLNFFQINNIKPYLISYEDLVKNPKLKIQECLSYLEIDDVKDITVARPTLQKQSDLYTEFLLLYYRIYFLSKNIIPQPLWSLLRRSKHLVSRNP